MLRVARQTQGRAERDNGGPARRPQARAKDETEPADAGLVGELTPKQAAAIAGVATNTVRLWAAAGQLPCRLTPGGHRRFDEEAVREWAALRARPVPEEPAGPRADAWRRSAEALLGAAIADLGPATGSAAPFRAALLLFRPEIRTAEVVPARIDPAGSGSRRSR